MLPVLNESESLPPFLASLGSYLRANFNDETIEVIVINNGSTDDTSGVATRTLELMGSERVVTVYREFRWRDYSEAVRRGILLARGQFVAWLGVDIEDLGSIRRGLSVMKQKKADIVILSKYLGADWRPTWRILMNRSFVALVRLLDGLWYSDIEGYMIIARRAVPLLNSLGFSRGNTLNLNLVFFGRRLGMRIEEAPLYVTERRRSVFLTALARVVWLDLMSVLTVHKSFKRFAGMRSHQHISVRQS